ncbi:MAG: hypothetical protein WHX52_20595 [Anaerolineae bacterium]
MKKILALVLLLLIVAMTVSPAWAALPGPGWWTSFQIQNVSDGDATIAYTAYWNTTGSSETYVQDGTIVVASGAAVIYNPGQTPNYPTGNRIGFDTTDSHLPAGFMGGVEVSSDAPVRAVVQVGNNPNGSVGVANGRAAAFYQGTQGEDVGTEILFPSMKHNYYGQTTTFFIQAAGEAAVINATFKVGATTYPLTGINIPAGRIYLLDPVAAGVPAGNTSLGSLTVTATSGKIAGTVVETQHSVSVGTFALSTKGFAPADADSTIVAPTNKLDFFGGNTGWQILNTGATTATVVVDFTVTNIQPGSPAATAGIEIGDKYQANITIPAGGTYLFSKGQGNLQTLTPQGDAPAMAGGVFLAGIAVSTNNQPLLGTINENNGPNRVLYSAFSASSATSKVAAPLVKEKFFNFSTGVTVQNVSTVPATVNLTYNCQTGGAAATYNVGPYTIEAGAAMPFNDMSNATRWGSVKVAANSQCAVTIVSTQPIVALIQEAGAADTKNYEGFNLP